MDMPVVASMYRAAARLSKAPPVNVSLNVVPENSSMTASMAASVLIMP